ncbi:hypothetical protein, partial [Bifidobacterium biavatii]|uniref:hypothetical protein n=1 Tax=Bifidobacterium biavatii TaxID=762212 RepID=UPI0019D370D5
TQMNNTQPIDGVSQQLHHAKLTGIPRSPPVIANATKPHNQHPVTSTQPNDTAVRSDTQRIHAEHMRNVSHPRTYTHKRTGFRLQQDETLHQFRFPYASYIGHISGDAHNVSGMDYTGSDDQTITPR